MAERSARAELKNGVKLIRVGKPADALEYLRLVPDWKQQDPYCLPFHGVAVVRAQRKWNALVELCELTLGLKHPEVPPDLSLPEVVVSAGRCDGAIAVLDTGLHDFAEHSTVNTPANCNPSSPSLSSEPTQHTRMTKSQLGFSVVELLIVVLVLGVLLAMAVSSTLSIARNYRITSDGRGIAAELVVGRMRAAADFTHARLYMDLDGNTFHLEVWNKAAGCWKTEGDATDCTQTTSPVTSLAQGDTFGFGSITSGPTAATGATAQAPACTVGVAGATAGSNIANTACIEMNSRGFPVDSTNNIVASDAIYLTNSQKAYSAIAVSISGLPTAYSYNGSNWIPF
jgi:prepilin-type N-terminal cleavage/methylation domain-containing protein